MLKSFVCVRVECPFDRLKCPFEFELCLCVVCNAVECVVSFHLTPAHSRLMLSRSICIGGGIGHCLWLLFLFMWFVLL